MNPTLAWCALFASGLAAGADEKPPPRVEPSPQAPLGQVLEWTSAPDKPFWYRLPRRLDPKKPPRLVLMLHGTGLKWGWAFWNYPIAAGSFRGEDVVVAPEGMTPGQGDTFNFIQGKADGDHIAGLIVYLKQQLPISKVYIYGHSQGAFFAYWFAGEHPDLVDGIVAHAGNVLANVQHPALAREKLGVAILHGRADAVVPVDCATATEKIYRERGYKKVKLQIVDGLTEQSGHWPLPKQAGELLAWLDSVSPEDAALSVASILSALGRDEPDLASAVDSAGRAAAAIKSYRGKDRAAVTDQLTALRKWLDEAAQAQAEAVVASLSGSKGEPPFGPWAAHYQRASHSLGSLPAWQKAVASVRKRATAHDKTVARALGNLRQAGAKAFGDAIRAAEEGFLAASYEPLILELRRLANDSTTKADDRKRLDELLAARTTPWAEGVKAAVALDQKLARSLREAHAEWFKADAPP